MKLSKSCLVVVALLGLVSFGAGVVNAYEIIVKPDYVCSGAMADVENEDGTLTAMCAAVDEIGGPALDESGNFIAAPYILSDDTPSINLCSNGVVPVQVTVSDSDFNFDVETATVKMAGVEAAFYAYEDADLDGEQDDLFFYFPTKALREITDGIQTVGIDVSFTISSTVSGEDGQTTETLTTETLFDLNNNDKALFVKEGKNCRP